MRLGFREMVFLLLLIAMPTAVYFFVFQPRNAQIAIARQEIRHKQAKLQQVDEFTRSQANMGTETEKLSKALAVFEQKLPARREVEVILKQVWELAAKNNLTPRSVRTDTPLPSEQYTEQPIRMTIVGDFDGFYKFLLELERLPRITKLPKMELKKLDKDPGQMQADMVLSVFFDSQDDKPEGATANGSGRRS